MNVSVHCIVQIYLTVMSVKAVLTFALTCCIQAIKVGPTRLRPVMSTKGRKQVGMTNQGPTLTLRAELMSKDAAGGVVG